MSIEPTARKGEIWSVGGGKGGTGKSFLVSCIGTALARKKHQVTLVDLDLGGANLHSFFGLSGPRPSLTTFFEFGSRLDELRFPTGVENLSLITGNAESMTSTNIQFSQKLKLYRQMTQLNTQFLIVDLGAGCHVNTLDSFLAADRMIVVTVPEVPSVENMYVFIKNALFRKFKVVLKNRGFGNVVSDAWADRRALGLKNIKDLVEHLRHDRPETGSYLDELLAGFKVHLVINQIRDHKDVGLGLAIKSIFSKYLGLEVRFAGTIEYDDAVWKSVREGRPFLLSHQTSPCARQIEDMTDNILNDREAR